MTRAHHPRTHRFVVVWRTEAREIAGAEEVRRGWVERVLDPLAAEAGEGARTRLGFHALADLPGLIEQMIETAEAKPTPDKRRLPE